MRRGLATARNREVRRERQADGSLILIFRGAERDDDMANAQKPMNREEASAAAAAEEAAKPKWSPEDLNPAVWAGYSKERQNEIRDALKAELGW